jgi:ATP-dependent DNA helicase RecQ
MGALTVAEAARPVLEGGATVQLRRVAAPVARTKKARSVSGAAASAASPADNALFERLRALRRELADADGVPAYVVLPDRTLWELVASKPTSTDGLLAVNGIGPAKAEKYGTQFLALLAETA